MRRSAVTGQFVRQGKEAKVHSMFVTWAAHVRLILDAGQGYKITDVQNYSGLPACSSVPPGVEFTSADDRAIENFLLETTDKYRELAKRKYLEGKRLNRYAHAELLDVACKWLYS